METVYLETTFLSYLVANPARDLVIAAHQQITREWWALRRDSFRCAISSVVVDEISQGDKGEVKKRLEVAQSLDILTATIDAEELTEAIINTGAFPERAVRDAAHIAIATVHGVEYMLTWNCKHLANAQIARRIQRVCDAMGFEMPRICTPEELMEATSDD